MLDEEKMMLIDEWNKQFSCKYMQQPISFLTEENLDRLQQHCEKTIQYGNGRILEEHQVTLELIIRYRELKQELEKEKEKNNNAKWYIHQEVVRIMEDIEDYIDDDKEGNKHIIGEFKEDLKQWQDVEKLLDGKTKDELYIDWRKYGEYE